MTNEYPVLSISKLEFKTAVNGGFISYFITAAAELLP